MRDFKGPTERIEPSFGADPLMDVPVRRRRAVADNTSEVSPPPVRKEKDEVSPRVSTDILLDSASATSKDSRDAVSPRFTSPPDQVRPIKRRASSNKQRVPMRQGSGYLSSLMNRRNGMILLMLLLAVAVYFSASPLMSALERPIKSVVVEGEFNFITKQRATELISNEIDNDFLQVDLTQIKTALLNDPWVEKVSLERRWPDTLVVKIAEQKPIARWGNGFLNQRGEIIRDVNIEHLSGLPWLQGNESDAVEILQQYQELSQVLRSRGLDVIALHCDNKKAWRLTVKNHVEIAMGSDQIMEKIRRFVTVYDAYLNNVWNDVKTIDVRYSNGIAVRWVPDSEMAKKHVRTPLQVDVPGAI